MSANAFGEIIIVLIKSTWPLLIFILVVYIIRKLFPAIFKKIRMNKKYSSINTIHADKGVLNKLRNLKPFEFEDYIATLYSHLGYKTEKVGQSYDGGIDVVAEKDGIKHYIQCKKFITSKVSVNAVRDFYGAMSDKMANGKGIFITTNVFTTEAEKFAEGNLIELIDGYKLLRLIKLANKNQNIDIPTTIDTQINKCPFCGWALVKRSGRFGEFLGCSNFPKCRYTKK